MDDDVIISSTEIIKDRLYFATLKAGFKPKPTRNSKYFHIEDDIVYENFYFDFGPYHICHLRQFCIKLNDELARNPKKKIVFYTSDSETLRLNAACLIGSYQIIYLNTSPAAAYKQLTDGSEWTLTTFRDASGRVFPSYSISMLDVLQGIKVAHDAKFFDFEHFDEEQYLFYEKVENGDLNWIIPGKMLAFSGPHYRSRLDHGYPLHSPEHYHDYFRRHNVKSIVRLNKKSYDAKQFTSHGFKHNELFFVDGSVPSEIIVNRFINIAENTEGAIAVHCKAGLGRTGTLIGCYMMKHHGFTAKEAIAWLRMCRPGSVIGHQQWFLENIQPRMLALGEAYRRRHKMAGFPVFSRGIYSDLPPEPTPSIAKENEQKPVSLQSILINKNDNKLDNGNVLNANEKETDSENNVTAVIGKYKTTPTPMLPTKRVFAPKMNYMMPTNNIRNSNNTNLKTQSRINSNLKSHYAAKTSTFPPTRSANSQASKLSGTVKSPFTGKGSFHGQRANLAHGSSPLKTFTRKTVTKLTSNDTTAVTSLTNVTSTLSALTENCNLNGKNRLPSDSLNNVTPKSPSNINNRKKLIINSRKKLPKTNLPKALGSNQELSSSDTNVTNISADSLETPFRFRRKRDKSSSPEPMDCISNSVITSDVTPDCYDESTNSQGNKLYKIKALRKKCPTFGVSLLKKDGVQTRSSTGASSSTVKKK